MKPLREPKVLREEAAAARDQAQALHRAATDAVGAENASWGAQRDVAQRSALAARANADAALKQAGELTAESNRHAELAGEYNAHAAQLQATNSVEAEEWFENATGIVRVAESISARATAAREAAEPLVARAEELEQAFQRIENGPIPPHIGRLERAADQLDEKARLLDEAAQQQRDAAVTGDADPGATAGSMNWARYALEKADAIQLDFDGVDPAVLRAAGIPPSQIPGTELVEPTAQVTDTEQPSDDVVGAPAHVADDASHEEGSAPDVAAVDMHEFGNDDPATPTFDDPIAVGTGFQDFGDTDDSINDVPTEDMTFEFES